MQLVGTYLVKDKHIIDHNERCYWYDGSLGPAIEGRAISFDKISNIYNVIFDCKDVLSDEEQAQDIIDFSKLPGMTDYYPLE